MIVAGVFLTGYCGKLAELAGGDLRVLCAHGFGQIARRQTEGLQALRLIHRRIEYSVPNKSLRPHLPCAGCFPARWRRRSYRARRCPWIVRREQEMNIR